MIYAYARVSTAEQCLDRQIDTLTKYGVDMIFKEKMSGIRVNSALYPTAFIATETISHGKRLCRRR